MNFGRAEVRRILKRDSAQAERFIRNRKSEFTRSGLLTHRKSVLASSGIHFKSQILHVDLIGFHQAPLSQQLRTASKASISIFSIAVPALDRALPSVPLQLPFDP